MAILIIAWFICTNLIFVLGMTAAAKFFRLKIEEIFVFNKPLVFRTQVGNTWLSLGSIPLGSSLKFSDEEFRSAGFLRQTFVILSGITTLFAIAVAIIGVTETIAVMSFVLRNYFLGAWSPIQVGKPLLLAAADHANQVPPIQTLGEVSAAFAMINLLPIPPLNGGQVICLAISRIWKSTSEGPTIAVTIVGVIFLLGIMISWTIALIAAVLA